MQKPNKALQRMKSRPKDFSWRELQSALGSLGFTEHERSGSRKCFVHPETNHKIQLHKRHPDSTLLPYQLKEVLGLLLELGYMENE